MNVDTATTPVDGGEVLTGTEVADQSVSDDTSNLETQGDDTGDGEGGEGDEEIAEVEFDGAKIKAPKSVAEKVADLISKRDNMNADYTRKTQEHAEKVRAWEAERAQHTTADAEHLNLRAMVVAIDAKLDEISKTDLSALSPEQRAEIRDYRDSLRDAKTEAQAAVTTHETKRAQEAESHRTTQLQEAHTVLAKDIPGWGTPQVTADLMTAGEKFGFAPAELGSITDPRMIKVLHAAMSNAKTATQTAKVEQIAAGQKTQPVATTRGAGGAFQAKADTNDFAAFERLADAKLKKKA